MGRGLATFSTSTFWALDHAFYVTTWDRDLSRYLEHLLGGFCTPTRSRDPVCHYELTVARVDAAYPYETWRDGQRIAANSTPGSAVDAWLWHLNRDVLAAARDRYLLVHAAAATRDEHAVVLPAASGAGKSTFVAALVRAGLRYVTDEAVAIDRETGHITPYPKPLTVKRGSFGLLAPLRPPVPPLLEDEAPSQWHVAPAHLGDGIPASGPLRATLVVTPRYAPDVAAVLEPVPRAALVAEMARHAHRVGTIDRRDLDLLARVVRQASCHRISTAALDDAVDAVRAALAGMSGAGDQQQHHASS